MITETTKDLRAALKLLQYFCDAGKLAEDEQQILDRADTALTDMEQIQPRMCSQGCGVVLGTDGCPHPY
jgi:hypothetical protein